MSGMSDALDGEIQPIARNPLRAWVRVTLHKLDATIAARRLVQGLSSGAFSEAVAAGLESVTVAFDAKTLTLIGVEMAVREVRDFLQKIDSEAAVATAAGQCNWVDDPAAYAAPPLSGVQALRADFWPEDESADDLIDMVREARHTRRSREIE